jgi:hypothetical protein
MRAPGRVNELSRGVRVTKQRESWPTEAFANVFRNCIVFVGFLACSSYALAASHVATEAATGFVEGTLLGTSQSIAPQLDAAKRHRVKRELAELGLPSPPFNSSPLKLQVLLSTSHLISEESQTGQAQIEVEVFASRPVGAAPKEPIPFGLAGIAWGVRHPRSVWRLFLPVRA